MNKKSNKLLKRRLRFFLGPISIGVFCFLIYTTFNYVYTIENLKNRKKELEQKLVILKEEAKEMNNEIERLKDPEYIAKYARENYYYTKSGEYVLKINKKEKLKQETNKITKKEYYRIAGYTISGVLFLYIITKIIRR
ncbi:MAG: septum formation initiator family protein [Bacilli bacterium]